MDILPGSYRVIVNAERLAPFASAAFFVTEEQAHEIPDVLLSAAAASIEVTVRPTDLIAAEQIKSEEKQRLIGVIPNLYTIDIPVSMIREFLSKRLTTNVPGYGRQ
jgi:hypothetical protein